MISGQLLLAQLATPVENIPLAFRCGFVLLFALVMVLTKGEGKSDKIKKYSKEAKSEQ